MHLKETVNDDLLVESDQFIDQFQDDKDLDELDKDDSDVVYTIDGIIMRKIQIEGEDQEYLMDPANGKIFDMQANFIGVANTDGLVDD